MLVDAPVTIAKGRLATYQVSRGVIVRNPCFRLSFHKPKEPIFLPEFVSGRIATRRF
jgi:hypothetical protein